MEIKNKNIDAVNLLANGNINDYQHKNKKVDSNASALNESHKAHEALNEDRINVKGVKEETKTDNSKKISELKNRYNKGTLTYDSKDVAKAFLKEAVGIY
ncbi:MAG: hypothetical protein ACOX3T_06245 [Bdellovibrionota bacterium]